MNKTSIELFIENLPERFKNAILNTCSDEILKAKEREKDNTIEFGYKMQIIKDVNPDGNVSFVFDPKEYYTSKYEK